MASKEDDNHNESRDQHNTLDMQFQFSSFDIWHGSVNEKMDFKHCLHNSSMKDTERCGSVCNLLSVNSLY
jgi:hypothetical protein